MSIDTLITRLPDGWSVVPFGSVLDGNTRNGIYKSKEFHGRGAKVVNMGELFAYKRLFPIEMKRVELTEKERESFLLNPGDLLFARRSLVAEGAGRCSVVCEIDEPTTFESSIIRARPKKSIAHGMFLFYLFSSPIGRHLIGTLLRQTSVSGITGTDLVKLDIPLPPVAEQIAIAKVLGALDDKIELNRQMNHTLEAMAQALFKSWFVDFDPVTAKAAGRSPFGMDAETAALFPSSFSDTSGNGIPSGWLSKPLDEVADFLNGLALQKFPPSGHQDLPVIKIAEMRRGITESTGRANSSLPEKYIIDDGDVLFSWSGTLDVVLWCGGKGALNQHLFKVKSDKYPKWFYYFWVKEHLADFQGIAADKVTTMGHIKRGHLTQAFALIPSQEIIEIATVRIQPLVENIVLNNIESRTLSELRDLLLPKLMCGEVRIRQAEKMLAEAV